MAQINLSSALAEIKTNHLKFYTYTLHCPKTGPFYVGMGTRNRIRFHEVHSGLGRISHKYSFIRKITKSGNEVLYQIKFFSSRSDASDEEARLIAYYGRRDNGSGPLLNLTNGRDGSDGYRHTEASLAKISAVHLGKKKSDIHRARISAAHLGVPKPKLQIEKSAKSKTGSKHSETAKTRMSIASKNAWSNPERIAAARQRMATRWQKNRSEIIGSLVGRKHSEETKRKIGLSHLGRLKPRA
jgi:hypothetical protein